MNRTIHIAADSSRPTMCAMPSADAPSAKGTISVMGFAGKVWARTANANASAALAIAKRMVVLIMSCLPFNVSIWQMANASIGRQTLNLFAVHELLLADGHAACWSAVRASGRTATALGSE